jgi:hypothetical protein
VKRFKAAVVFLITAGLFYLILAYIADFSVQQSVVLACFIASLALAIENRAAKPTMRFTPYYVRVAPKWCELLLDFKLISKPEEWYSIQNGFESLPATEYRVLRDGIHYTTLQQSEDAERTLIYSYNHRVFVSDVDFEEDLEPIKLERPNPIRGLRSSPVSLFMKFGSKGYDLGLRVPDWWWEQAKPSCTAPMKEKKDYVTGTVELVLATISARAFDLHWEPVVWGSTFFNETAN